MEAAVAKPRLASLLEHFSVIEDPRERWRVLHPLPEVLLLVVCATIASCDDFDDIEAWGKSHLGFLRRFLPFEYGVPSGRWLNILMNRIDPELFSACFMAWTCTLRDDAPDLIALDNLVRQSAGGCADVVEPHHVGDARSLGGGGHGFGIRQRFAEGLFAEHRLAGGDGCQGDLAMGALG